jgi:riboflavin synthase
MFTGLVEGQGTVRQIASLPVGLRLSIAPDADCFTSSELAIGDSVSICGCCLTVVAIRGDALDFEAGDETLSKTNLGRFKIGSRVNLERSLAANARLGGHFVQGHVDGVATVSEIVRNGDWIDMWFTPTAEQHRLLVPKGSVAIDGISLTIVNVTTDRFSVALIPHTLQVTTLGSVTVGDVVNIENDILGKYVDQLLERRLATIADLMGSDPIKSLSPQTIAALRTQLNPESPPPQ